MSLTCGLGLGFPLQFGSSLKLGIAISTAFRDERERERESWREESENLSFLREDLKIEDFMIEDLSVCCCSSGLQGLP
jgi:hypothetical protein